MLVVGLAESLPIGVAHSLGNLVAPVIFRGCYELSICSHSHHLRRYVATGHNRMPSVKMFYSGENIWLNAIDLEAERNSLSELDKCNCQCSINPRYPTPLTWGIAPGQRLFFGRVE
jgi:hypothetical protein